MYLEVYVDVLFLINFCMDLIILKILKSLLKEETSWLRILSAGIIGALGSVLIALMPNMPDIIRFILMYILISGLMVEITFLYRDLKRLLKGILLLYIITYFIGGFINSIYYHTDLGFYFNELLNKRLLHSMNKTFFICASAAAFVAVKLFLYVMGQLKNQMKKFYQVELILNDRRRTVRGLLDTGNSLREAASNKPVAVIEYEEIKTIISEQLREYICKYYQIQSSEEIEQEESALEAKDAVRIRLIPYRSIGKEEGMLLGIQFDQLNVCTQKKVTYNKKAVVAVYPGQLSGKKEYRLILHKDLL